MRMKRGMIGFVLAAAAVGAVFILRGMNPLNFSGLTKGEGASAKGPAIAPVTIVEYSDFQCPACGAAQKTLQELYAKYPGKIQIVFRHFPLKMHVWSDLAHTAAECAGEQGKFWELHDKLFATQMLWAQAADNLQNFLGYAKEAGVNLDQFGKCLAGEEAKKRVQSDRQQGDLMQINSTPTFFINGERFVGPVELKTGGEALIRKILGLPEEKLAAVPAAAPPAPAAPQP